MPHTDHQQNETNPNGGRDLGQITLQTVSIADLLNAASAAHKYAAEKKAKYPEEDFQHVAANTFFCYLVGTIESRYGITSAKALADAAGFNFLFSETDHDHN